MMALLAATLGLCASFAQAQVTNSVYVIDGRGEVATSGTGLCWRTGFWTPAMAIAECDPDLVKKAAPAAAAPAAKKK